MQLGVYLLMDVSASMSGAPLQALYEGYELSLASIRRVFADWDSIHVSAVFYESSVTELYHNQLLSNAPRLPEVIAQGATRLGSAIEWLADRLAEDQDRHAPLVLLFTDDVGVDDWLTPCSRLDAFRDEFVMFGFNCGDLQTINLFPYFTHVDHMINIGKLDDLLKRQWPTLVKTAKRVDRGSDDSL